MAYNRLRSSSETKAMGRFQRTGTLLNLLEDIILCIVQRLSLDYPITMLGIATSDSLLGNEPYDERE